MMALQKVVPILIAARNEELSIGETLASIVRSIEYFRNVVDTIHRFPIIVCNNNSTDNTTSVIQQFHAANREKLSKHAIDLEVIDEEKPGKLNALKRLIQFAENRWQGQFDVVIFSDAEIEWSEQVFHALFTYKKQHPELRLVGSNFKPRHENITIWGTLESLPFWGWGELPLRGHGLLTQCVCGMCYLADQQVLHYLRDDIPPQIGDEDIAISILVRPEYIGIAQKSIVWYDPSENFSQFLAMPGRRIKEAYRLQRWLRIRELKLVADEFPHKNEQKHCKIARKRADEKFWKVSEMRAFPITLRYCSSVEKSTISKDGLKRWIRSVPLFNLSLQEFFCVVFLMFPMYSFLKIKACIDLSHNSTIGWNPVRAKKHEGKSL